MPNNRHLVAGVSSTARVNGDAPQYSANTEIFVKYGEGLPKVLFKLNVKDADCIELPAIPLISKLK